jgi:signal peptidase I
MKFYRLEKQNPFKFWAYVGFKGILWGLIITIAVMLLAGYKFMIVSSGSMEPTLPVGSLVIVTPCEYEDLQLGDIVTMDAGGIALTHRIIGKYNPGHDYSGVNGNDNAVLLPGDEGYDEQPLWVTQGDNSDTIDGALTNDIIGKVYDAHAFSWVGTLVRYVRGNYMMLFILLIIFIVFTSVLEWLKNLVTPDDIEVYESDEE